MRGLSCQKRKRRQGGITGEGPVVGAQVTIGQRPRIKTTGFPRKKPEGLVVPQGEERLPDYSYTAPY